MDRRSQLSDEERDYRLGVYLLDAIGWFLLKSIALAYPAIVAVCVWVRAAKEPDASIMTYAMCVLIVAVSLPVPLIIFAFRPRRR